MSKFYNGNRRASRLTSEQVLLMRERYQQGATQGQLCREFDVSIAQVGRIVRGEAHRYVPMPVDYKKEGEALAQRVLAKLGMPDPMDEFRSVDRLMKEAQEVKAKELKVEEQLKELTGEKDNDAV